MFIVRDAVGGLSWPLGMVERVGCTVRLVERGVPLGAEVHRVGPLWAGVGLLGETGRWGVWLCTLLVARPGVSFECRPLPRGGNRSSKEPGGQDLGETPGWPIAI